MCVSVKCASVCTCKVCESIEVYSLRVYVCVNVLEVEVMWDHSMELRLQLPAGEADCFCSLLINGLLPAV